MAIFADAQELRALADLMDTQNEVVRGLGHSGAVIQLDSFKVLDANGNPLATLSWRTERDGFGVGLEEN